MTALDRPGRWSGGPLVSDVKITDDNWHRVGIAWDGSNRSLYVDDLKVAADVLSGFWDSVGGLHMGADKDLEPGIFWSGLIDDVRIYNRVIKP